MCHPDLLRKKQDNPHPGDAPQNTGSLIFKKASTSEKATMAGGGRVDRHKDAHGTRKPNVINDLRFFFFAVTDILGSVGKIGIRSVDGTTKRLPVHVPSQTISPGLCKKRLLPGKRTSLFSGNTPYGPEMKRLSRLQLPPNLEKKRDNRMEPRQEVPGLGKLKEERGNSLERSCDASASLK